VIKAADQTIADRDKTIKDLKLGLTNCGQDTRVLETKVQDKDAELGKFWRNPWIMTGVGLVLGAYLMRR
jgi:hypothetical protein